MIKHTIALCLAAIVLVLPGAALTTRAQGGLTTGEPVSGMISPGQPADYVFNGTAGEVISLHLTADDETFDPALTLLEGSDRVLLTNDDYAYPATRDALLEAITLPRTGLYTARVEGFAGSAGAYTLTLRRGFTEEGHSDSFGSNRGWSAAEPGSARIAASELVIDYSGQGFISAFNDSAPSFSDFYARVEVTDVRATEPGWIAGLTARYPTGNQIALHVRGDGTWRVIEQTDAGETVLRDWSIHPAIVAGQTDFAIGMLARNQGFHLFYNDTLLGTIATPLLTGTAQIGLAAGIQRALPQDAAITYDNLTISVPLTVDDAVVLPDSLVVGDSQTILYALTRRHQVPAAGQLSLTVPESTVQFARSGVNRLIVGGGITYQNFALGATIDMAQNSVGLGGCGLVLRSQSEDDYALAFFDSAGGYGLSVQAQGEFQPGLFSQGLAEGRTHHLLVIADDTTLYLYVDGIAAGTLVTPAVPGQVGGAVVNYDAVDTLCTFRNLWVYSWGA